MKLGDFIFKIGIFVFYWIMMNSIVVFRNGIELGNGIVMSNIITGIIVLVYIIYQYYKNFRDKE